MEEFSNLIMFYLFSTCLFVFSGIFGCPGLRGRFRELSSYRCLWLSQNIRRDLSFYVMFLACFRLQCSNAVISILCTSDCAPRLPPISLNRGGNSKRMAKLSKRFEYFVRTKLLSSQQARRVSGRPEVGCVKWKFFDVGSGSQNICKYFQLFPR